LVPGEQFGLGGAQSLRGFEERELLADNGWQTNLEVLAPPLGNSGISLLAIYDLGHLENEGDTGQGAQVDPASAGLGLRWFWRDRMSISADVASVLEGAGNTEDGDTALHFSLFYRF
jgi:hemolysin activation/secretion protein